MCATDERRQAFEQLFANHYWAVRAYLVRRGRRVSVEDVLADTFLVAWRRLDEVPNDPLPWLIAVARRTLANHLRAQRRHDALTGRLSVFSSARTDWHAPNTLSDEFAMALESLPEREREALLLVAWEGLSPTRAAQAAGCTAATFRVRLHRARHHVADHLSRQVPNPAHARAREEIP